MMQNQVNVLFLSPLAYALLGAAIAFFVAALGSSKGVGIAGQAAAGVVAEDPGKFTMTMILQALPSTQSIYGLVITILILGKITPELTIEQGTALFMVGLPVGFVGYLSGVYQGKVAAAGINLIAKRPEEFGKAMIYAINVELFAIFSFATSIFMLGKI
jgi:V/A-type H+-transporting ATPase subunit K